METNKQTNKQTNNNDDYSSIKYRYTYIDYLMVVHYFN